MSEVINLNVGGKLYTTTKETLTHLKGTMLEAMFSGRYTTKEVDGRYFIDRDGKLFRHILSYLRDGEEWVPPREQEFPALLKEAQYFGIDPLVKIIEEWPKKTPTVSSFVIRVSGSHNPSIITKLSELPGELDAEFRTITWYTDKTVEKVINMCREAGYDFVGSVTPLPGISGSLSYGMYMSFRLRD